MAIVSSIQYREYEFYIGYTSYIIKENKWIGIWYRLHISDCDVVDELDVSAAPPTLRRIGVSAVFSVLSSNLSTHLDNVAELVDDSCRESCESYSDCLWVCDSHRDYWLAPRLVTWLDSVVLLRNYLEKNLESRDCLEAMWTIGNFGILVWGLCKLGGQLGPNSGAEVSSLGTEL